MMKKYKNRLKELKTLTTTVEPEKSHEAILKEKTVTIIVLALIIISTFTILVIRNERRNFEEGANFGYEQVIIQITNQAVTCNQVPLSIGNQTINLIAVECLKE